MNAPDFHTVRLTGLGSSDAAPACGVSRFRTAFDVYQEKRGETRGAEENDAMRFGTLLEPVILDEFERRSGLMILRKPPVARSVDHPFMLAHLDAVTEQTGPAAANAVVEAKCSRSGEGFGEPGTADIPIDYLVQTHHQMIVVGCTLAFVPVLIAGSDFRIYEIPFDQGLGDLIVANEATLWDRIQRADPPEIDPDAPGALDLIRRVYRGTNGKRVRATSSDEHWRAVFHEATAKREKYATTADGAKAHLLLEMGDNAELEFADGATLRRKLITVKGYTVEPREQIDARFIKAKD